MAEQLLPLHTYFERDAFCTLVLANPSQTFAEFAGSVAELVCGLRVEPRPGGVFKVTHNGEAFDSASTIAQSGLRPFERVDVGYE